MSGVAETRIVIRPKRQLRAQFASTLLQHGPAVAAVLAAGASALRTERAGWGLALGAVEILVGVWVLATVALEARHLFAGPAGHAGHEDSEARPARVDPAGLAAAALGYVEVWHRTHVHGHFKLVSPQMLTATTALFFALGGRALIHRRFRRRGPHFAASREGVRYRAGRWSRWAAAWPEVAAVESTPGVLAFRLRDGRRLEVRAEHHFGGESLVAAARRAVAAHAPPHLGDLNPPETPRSPVG